MNTDHLTCNSNHNEIRTDKMLSQIVGERGPRDQKLKIKTLNTPYGFRDVTYSSNLEFTRSIRDRNLPHSLLHMKPDHHNITPHKIILEITDSKGAIPKQITKEIEETPSSPKVEEGARDLDSLSIEEILGGREAVPLYEVWPSKNRFYFQGRLMTGPKSDRKSNIIAWSFLLVISILFFAFGWSFLLGEVTLILPLSSVFLFICTVLFFFMTSFTDPGIIPRKQISELCGNNGSPLQTSVRKEGSQQSQNTSYQLTLDSTKKRSISKYNSSKFCQVCNIVKPNKTTHCNDCDNCVEGFERHAHFLNNCIGKRNYKYFIGFVASLILLSISYVLGFLIIIVTRTAGDPDVDRSTAFLSTTVTIIIIVILGVPCIVMLLIILLFGLLKWKCLFKTKITEYQTKSSGSILSSFSWLFSKPSQFKPRQIISKDNLINYQNHIKKSHSS